MRARRSPTLFRLSPTRSDSSYDAYVPTPTISVLSDVGTPLYDSLEREIFVRRAIGYGAPVKKPAKCMPKMPYGKKPAKKGGK